MSFAIWALVAGAILLTMALLGTLLERLPLSPGILYLGIGYALGPAGWALMTPDPLLHAVEVETMAEIALLISLFSVGLKLGVPLDRRWYLPLRLAFPSMALTVMFVTAIGVFLLGLPLGAAILLAAILAPTDPVLASDVQVEHSSDRDRLRFGLTAEGGLNDGAAFPFVLLALGLLVVHDFGSIWRWFAVDVVWSILGGLAIGGALGTLIGKLVLYLRTRHQEAVGLDEFLALGLIAIAFGVAQLSMTSGFLAVFTAGLALQRVKGHSQTDTPLPSAAKVTMTLGAEGEKEIATHVQHAGTYMMDAVVSFNGQLERLAELVVVMVAGAMLSYTYFPERAIWFLLLLFVVARPLSVWLGLLGATTVSRDQRILISWFGIRGVGSIFYLMYAINHGLPAPLANELIAITLTTVAASILVHGISVTPLMALYAKRKTRSGQ
jgi:NhaP-type Na+/H+ or K+/H+ antiporter